MDPNNRMVKSSLFFPQTLIHFDMSALPLVVLSFISNPWACLDTSQNKPQTTPNRENTHPQGYTRINCNDCPKFNISQTGKSSKHDILKI